jgi:hypothetical protein
MCAPEGGYAQIPLQAYQRGATAALHHAVLRCVIAAVQCGALSKKAPLFVLAPTAGKFQPGTNSRGLA